MTQENNDSGNDSSNPVRELQRRLSQMYGEPSVGLSEVPMGEKTRRALQDYHNKPKT